MLRSWTIRLNRSVEKVCVVLGRSKHPFPQFPQFRPAGPGRRLAEPRGQPGLNPGVDVEIFEQFVLAKTYFDPEGLILACDGDRVLGFAHASFGANDAEDGISTELGTTALLMVRPDCDEAQVAAGLLEQSEAYLRRRGAKVIYGGGIRPLNGFYLGLYGGSELPGVPESDTVAQQAFLRTAIARSIARCCSAAT